MSQHDFSIANQTASNARTDINNALQALASLSSGTSAPTTTYANQFWYDTTNNILKMRNEANSAWLNVLYMDQSTGAEILDNTQVVSTSGTQTGLLGDQTTATWQAGTGTTQSLVSPANVKAAIDSLVSPYVIDYSAGYTSLTRTSGTAYQNTKSSPIFLYYEMGYNVGANAQISPNGSTWYTIHGNGGSSDPVQNSMFVPPSHYYKLTSAGGITRCVQLG